MSGTPPLRLAEMIAAISLATDLGTGQPMEHALRTCLLSLQIADRLDLTGDERSAVYYVALLRFLGCTADASEAAEQSGGDDITMFGGFAPVFMGEMPELVGHLVKRFASDQPVPRRLRLVLAALADTKGPQRSIEQHCEVGGRLADRIGLTEDVLAALQAAFERWDGKGFPRRLAGDAIPIAARVVVVARDVELWRRADDLDTACAVVRKRRGRAYDPSVADAFLADAAACCEGADAGSAWESVLDAEPAPVERAAPDRVVETLTAFADFADLKSPWTRGHSRGVATLAAAAARSAGLDETLLRRAGLVHDLGRVGVPNGIWDKRGALTSTEWERVRLHPYLTGRILARCTALADIADTAFSHHERLDGSGYHRGLAAPQLSPEARLLAAADAYHAMTEERPHRAVLSPSGAATQLRDMPLDRSAVEYVLEAAGHARRARTQGPLGLTEREVEVLRLLARGNSNRGVAAALTISPKTVGRHVENIYGKTGVSTRAGLALFAMEHGLLT